MVTLEQKIDLLMQLAVAKDSKEKSRLRDEIATAISDSAATPESTADISRTNDELMDSTIEFLLKELGAPCHLLGYDRTVYAIKLCITDPEYINHITHRLYPAIAKKFNTTNIRVERNIRHLIETAWSRHDLMDAYRIFGNTVDVNKGRPTNSEFIACCAREVKRRMRDVK